MANIENPITIPINTRSKNPRVSIEILKGVARHRMRPVRGPAFLIGSGSHCDLVLGDRHFPELHTYIALLQGSVRLRHIGPGPYVRVDGEVARNADLTDGQTIEIGPYLFRVHIADANATTNKIRQDGPHHNAVDDRELPSAPVRRPHVISEERGSWQAVTYDTELHVPSDSR